MEYHATLFWMLAIFGGTNEGVEATPPALIWVQKDELKTIAREFQLFDTEDSQNPYNGLYLFASEDNALEDFKVLYRRYLELKDAPLVEDFHPKFLMDTNLISKFLSFNYKFRQELDERQKWNWDQSDIIATARQEAEKMNDIWELINKINQDYMPKGDKRAAYLELKFLMGEAEFNKPELPDFVPTWRFKEVRLK